MRTRAPSYLLTSMAICLLVGGCGNRPNAPIISSDLALQWTTPWTMQVLAVYDTLNVPEPTHGASHLIEVSVSAPMEFAGKRFALPYDQWAMGEMPPKAGADLRLAPASWITGRRQSRGVPMEGFDGTKPLDRQ